MRKTAVGFLLATVYATCAGAVDTTSMSARILAATGNSDTSDARVSTRNSDNTTTNSDTAARTTSVRTRVASTTPKADTTTTANVVRSGNRVVNIDAPTQIGRTTDTTASTIARATRDRSGKNVAKSAAEKLESAVNNVGQSERTSATSINAKPAIRRAGLTLRPSIADVGGRAKIAGTDLYTGSNIDDEIRNVTARASKITAESIAEAKDKLEKTAELNKSCQDQYNECMDQFCAVIDANQKRCSCSANLKKYQEAETAVKNANIELNEVAQRIRYIGLSADEITAILTETEAEEVLSSTEDNTETRSLLEDIEKLIQDPTATISYTGTSGGTLDLNLDFDFSGDSGDMFSLDFLSSDSTQSFSNMRGTQLYNAAKNRCSTILKSCKEAGATQAQITGNYDLAIDKDCIAYENGLNKMNETLKSNVRNAGTMLQKARLAVLQNKNQYDAKGCISALETCMTDNMVCGKDYTKCLDPTKVYIDENGNVVMGQNIGDILAFMENYDNTKITSEWLTELDKTTISKSNCAGDNNDGACVAKYLMSKIGTGQKVTDGGLCRAVMNKCQDYTYNKDGQYQPYNEVVLNYVQRAMVNIRAAQSKIISDYASTCIKDMATCYNQQLAQMNAWNSSANASSILNIMSSTCRNVALTCAYAVFHYDDSQCAKDDDAAKQKMCIENISNVFYQAQLCPDNSTYIPATVQATLTIDVDGTVMGAINTRCMCNKGFEVSSSSSTCVATTDTTPTTSNTMAAAYVKAVNGYCPEHSYFDMDYIENNNWPIPYCTCDYDDDWYREQDRCSQI